LLEKFGSFSDRMLLAWLRKPLQFVGSGFLCIYILTRVYYYISMI
jgi:hypothetical protein